jgi:hypothetical protein
MGRVFSLSRRSMSSMTQIVTGRTSGTTTGRLAGVKVSVSLPDADVETLRALIRRDPGVKTLSGAVHEAVAALRERLLLAEYDDAMAEWRESGQEDDWGAATPDGLPPSGSP